MILISWPEPIAEEHKILNCLFAEGLQRFHIRKPLLGDGALGQHIKGIQEEFHDRIMLHQGYSLLEQFSCKGMHFPESKKGLFEKYSHLPVTKSWAVHALDEVNAVPDGVDYILLSPVFPSISKQGYQNNWPRGEPMHHLKHNKSNRFQYIALGGIDLETAPKALAMGFDGVAVMGAIWEAVLKGNDVNQVVSIFHALQKMCCEKLSENGCKH